MKLYLNFILMSGYFVIWSVVIFAVFYWLFSFIMMEMLQPDILFLRILMSFSVLLAAILCFPSEEIRKLLRQYWFWKVPPLEKKPDNS